jgi:hypothetical protein
MGAVRHLEGGSVEPIEPQAIETAEGARASIDGSEGDARIRVHDERGALIFEYRPAEGRSVVYAPSGNLELRADSGSIDLVAAEAVRVKSTRAVVIESEEAVHLEATDRGKASVSRLSLLRRAMVMAAPLVSTRAAKSEVEADVVEVKARESTSTVEHVRQVVETLETSASRILERAKESYREVEGLSQTRAGRLRMVAEKTLHVLGQRTLIKAYEDMKLRAEKIYIA